MNIEQEKRNAFNTNCKIEGHEPTDERYQKTQQLGELMSEASQDYIFAGWFGDWCATVMIAIGSGHTGFIKKHVNKIVQLATELGHYADYVYLPNIGEVYIPRNADTIGIVGLIYLEDDEEDTDVDGYIQTHSES